MRTSVKTTKLIEKSYPKEINIYENFSLNDKKLYRNYVLTKQVDFKSPSEWKLDNESKVMSFKMIANTLKITQKEAIEAYKSGVTKIANFLNKKDKNET